MPQNACPTLNVLSFSWTTSRGYLTWCRNMTTLTIWFLAKGMLHCGIVWHRNMATFTIWFPAKWMPHIACEMDVLNANGCPKSSVKWMPQMLVQHWNVLSFSWSTGRGFSWTTGRCGLVWCRNMANLTIWFPATLRAFAHRDDVETCQLSQSGSQQNGCPPVGKWFYIICNELEVKYCKIVRYTAAHCAANSTHCEKGAILHAKTFTHDFPLAYWAIILEPFIDLTQEMNTVLLPPFEDSCW